MWFTVINLWHCTVENVDYSLACIIAKLHATSLKYGARQRQLAKELKLFNIKQITLMIMIVKCYKKGRCRNSINNEEIMKVIDFL